MNPAIYTVILFLLCIKMTMDPAMDTVILVLLCIKSQRIRAMETTILFLLCITKIKDPAIDTVNLFLLCIKKTMDPAMDTVILFFLCMKQTMDPAMDAVILFLLCIKKWIRQWIQLFCSCCALKSNGSCNGYSFSNYVEFSRRWWFSHMRVQLVQRRSRVRSRSTATFFRWHWNIFYDHSHPLIQEWQLSVSGERKCTSTG